MKRPIRATLYICFSILPSASAFADCSLVKITQMPLFELGTHYAVMVQINDVMRSMVVDTGAATTTLDTSFVSKFNLKEDEVTPPSRSIGIGQTTGESHSNVIPSSFGLGDLIFHDRSTVVANMGFDKNPRERASVGLIGDDILSQYDVEFDFASKQLSFYRAQNCYDTFLPWTGPYAKVPFDHHDVKIVVDIVLNDERTRAIVDTGNNVSFVSRKSSALWNVPDNQFVNTKAVATSPLNGGTSKPIRNYTFETFKIGDETFYKKTIGIVDVDLSTGTANLGLDYFRTHKLWISYRNQMMFISRQPARSKLAYPVVEAKPMAAAN
jgi:Aspartyl protease